VKFKLPTKTNDIPFPYGRTDIRLKEENNKKYFGQLADRNIYVDINEAFKVFSNANFSSYVTFRRSTSGKVVVNLLDLFYEYNHQFGDKNSDISKSVQAALLLESVRQDVGADHFSWERVNPEHEPDVWFWFLLTEDESVEAIAFVEGYNKYIEELEKQLLNLKNKAEKLRSNLIQVSEQCDKAIKTLAIEERTYVQNHAVLNFVCPDEE
jgi:hypothetical protein